MASAPAWQTDELGEEWVETSPSPPGSPEAPPPASTHSKRGSLRTLGAGAARALPSSRRGSATGAPEYVRSPSNPYIRSASGMLSPPTSASGSEGDAREREREREREHGPDRDHQDFGSNINIHNTARDTPPNSTVASERPPGTFLVKDGEDTHGKAFPKNPFQKDMFSALALEKLFEPPSPPVTGSRGVSDRETSTSATLDRQLESVVEEEQSQSASPTPASETFGSQERLTPTSSRSSGTFKAVSPPLEDASPASAKSDSSSTPSSQSASSQSASSQSASSQSAASGGERRVSHPYAPVNPSRLSKSVTPSDSSFATTTEATHDTFKVSATDINIEDGPTFDYPTHEAATVEYPTIEPSTEIHDEKPASHPGLEASHGTAREVVSANPSPERELALPESPLTNPKYPFTFTAPVPQTSSRDKPVFDPSLEPLQTGEPSSSTLRNRPASRPVSGNVGLRLFRNTYDTYTREQLSALVDSIAFQPSPSPPVASQPHLRQWSPAGSETPTRSTSSDSTSTPASGSSAEARSSKRLRLSPPSPRGPSSVRDWRAHGRAMMDRIRVTDPEASATSASLSGTGSWDSLSRDDRSRSSGTPLSDGFSGYNGAPTFDFSQSAMDNSPSQIDQPGQFRSNPSTASSTYLHRAEDMMSRIKSRVVSPSTSTTVESPRIPRRNLSGSSRETFTSSEPEPRVPLGDISTRSAPKRVVHPPSESDESKDMSLEEESPESDHDVPSKAIQRSGSSRASVEGAGLPPNLPVNRDDLNRFMSASTYMTGTTVSTSFVKHAGPRDPALAPTMTQIRPGDVEGVLTERVGKMRFDRTTMRWVRDGNGSLGRVDEAGESRTQGSEESLDIFAGIESIGSVERTRGSSVAARVLNDESDTTVDDIELEARRTPRPSDYKRPSIHHSASAPPAVKTPGPATSTPAATPATNGLRSALRNPNMTPASALKKQAAWHPDLTPAPQGSVERSVSYKRSVSFSDNYIAPPRSAGGSISRRQVSTEEDLFQVDITNGSWLPSTRTRRIQDALEEMAEMSLNDSTPTKPQREKIVQELSTAVPEKQPEPIPATSPVDEAEEEMEETEDEDTIEPVPFGGRSFRNRTGGRADATFLTDCSFGLAHDRLVQLITDVQPFEPYWEQLRTIDLSNKGVDSLARLKEFLPMLDEARFDNNVIAYLSGVPNTVRTLHVAGNQLTSLTSVHHLRNLQYLDISRNQLDSVGQLECLCHLRELKADNNAITDLSGILAMDSLLKLSVSGNKIERVDLENAKWDKLENLNLSNNKIGSITGLHRLKSVSTLNLDKNRLIEIDVEAPLPEVRVLRFSDNAVTYIDLSLFPKVRTLFADNNALAGLSRSLSTGGHRIENLSVRNQRVGRFTLTAEDLQSVKRLYISGNRLDSDFLPRLSPLFNLVYLEAAACNLSSLPANFAQRAPNLRILNVNYNFLPDLDGLTGMVWLRKLMAVGNRLGGGAPGAARGLKGLTAMEEIDLRMNPSTLSFYLPIMMPNELSATSKNGTPSTDSNWPQLDAQFRRQLPDEWYSKRLVYRGLIMAQCPDLKLLDGVKVHEAEKRKAALLLEYASAAA